MNDSAELHSVPTIESKQNKLQAPIARKWQIANRSDMNKFYPDRSEMANILVMDSAEIFSVPTPISNYSKSRIILV